MTTIDNLRKEPMKRQQLWQLKMIAKGRCRTCAKPKSPHSVQFCSDHLKRDRERSRDRLRDRYRAQAGIPLDAPIRHGRPRI